MKATLWYVEFVENGLGIWDRAWFATKEEAEAGRQVLLASHGGQRQELTGAYGDVDVVQSVEVELTPEGVLEFAREFAIDGGDV